MQCLNCGEMCFRIPNSQFYRCKNCDKTVPDTTPPCPHYDYKVICYEGKRYWHCTHCSEWGEIWEYQTSE